MKKKRNFIGFVVVIALVCQVLFLDLGFAEGPAKGQPLFLEKIYPNGITWTPQIKNEGVVMTVSGVRGIVFHTEFGAGVVPSMNLLDEMGYPLADGRYSYELRANPIIDARVRKMLDNARDSEGRSMLMADLKEAGMLPSEALVQSGYFRVLNGKILVPSGSEETATLNRGISMSGTVQPLDQVINDDLIVTSSICVGFGCADGEVFGFDTLRLKENNTRLTFMDDSLDPFPRADWRIRANESSSGGADIFSIDYMGLDYTNGSETSPDMRTPFSIVAGAPNNSLYISSSGFIGNRTSTPAENFHIVGSDTPTVRLDQDASGGWTPQIWDVAGNESNFFIRDATGGSKLPFRIQPGAPTDSLTIKSDGKIGIGTWYPAHDLDVLLKTTSLVQLGNTDVDATNKAARMVVRHYNNAEEPVYLFGAASTSTNNYVALGGGSTLGNAATQIDLFTALNTTTPIGTSRLTILGSGYVGIGTQTPAYPLQMAGGAYTNGTRWYNVSSREFKDNIKGLKVEDAIETLQGLNPVTFSYKASPKENNVGFIAEEVPDLIAPKDRKGLCPMDIVAVLTKVVQELKARNEKLEQRVLALEGKGKMEE
jgi:hypothetical protein